MTARYRFSAEKAAAAIHWMVCQGQAVDLHAALKAFYFSDKAHLNAHYQPIFGATYRAMKYGPVPLEPYEMMKGEGLWLWEIKKGTAPWKLEGYNLRRSANVEPDLSVFSEDERRMLADGFHKSCSMTFTARTAATHGYDWQKAQGGTMLYEDMLDPANRTDEIIRYMKHSAPHLKL